MIRKHSPRAVINAAAYTAVDYAETHELLAMTINGDAPAAMAKVCGELGIPLVHISTDYVFDGTGSQPWTHDAPTAPQNAYGRTKLAGEVGVRDIGGPHVILRTSRVVSAHGVNFVKTMLRLGAKREALDVVVDQIGGPTTARAIAATCHAITLQLIADHDKSGTYHFAGTPDCSWANFSRAIYKAAGLTCIVTDIPSSAYSTPAVRPTNSRLDCSSLMTTFAIPRPYWKEGLKEIIKDLNNNTKKFEL